MDLLEETANIAGLTRLSDEEFELLRELIYQQFGISLTSQKRSLVVGRLNKVLRQQGFDSFKSYYDFVKGDQSGQALETLINRISTNHTFFWREADHFDFFRLQILQQVCSKLTAQGRQDLRIWCCGCSSGEEPYTIAMLVLESLGSCDSAWDVGILATDISSRVLEKAKTGRYRAASITNLPAHLKLQYFKRSESEDWEILDRVKRLVLFRRLNLMRKVMPFRGRFSVIFCRNVMIYFDQQTRQRILDQFSHFLEEGGYLFLGHSETLGRTNLNFRYIQPAVYQKVSARN